MKSDPVAKTVTLSHAEYPAVLWYHVTFTLHLDQLKALLLLAPAVSFYAPTKDHAFVSFDWCHHGSHAFGEVHRSWPVQAPTEVSRSVPVVCCSMSIMEVQVASRANTALFHMYSLPGMTEKY